MKRIFVDIDKCFGCRSCEIACAVEHSLSKDLFKAIKEDPLPRPRTDVQQDVKRNSFPLQCRHCEEPYCIDACIAGAIRKDPGTGLVVSDENKCVGCWTCLMVCPWGVIRPAQVSVRGKKKKVALSCDLCQDRETPACVQACPTGCLHFEEVEEFKKIKV
ncbi:MAG: 4Fe-4S dicluster domain-containing protein [bacterium]